MSAPRLRNVLVIGYYGAGNTGDEAVLTAMLRGLREGRSDLRFIVPGENPDRLAEAHGVVSFLPSDLDQMLDAVETADLVICGGGGLLHDYWDPRPETMLTRGHWGLTYYCGIPWLAAQLGKPVMLYAVGVGPLLFESGRDLVRDAALAARAITVRDAASADLLRELGVDHPRPELTADPVWQLKPVAGEALEKLRTQAGVPAGSWLGVCVRNWNVGVDQAAWENGLLEGLEPFAREHGFGVLFLPFQYATTPLQDDAGLARRIAGRLRSVPAAVVERRCTPEELGGLIGSCRALVGMRLHSLLFGCMGGVPAVALDYDPKVRQLAGMADPPLPVIAMANLTGERLGAALREVWSRREDYARGEAALAEDSRRRAARNTEIALGLLAHPPALAEQPGARRLLETARRLASEAPAPPAAAANRVSPRPVVRIVASGFFDPRGGTMLSGGAERYLIELARVVRSLGYPVEVFQRAEGKRWVRHYRDLRVTGLPGPDPFDLSAGLAAEASRAPILTIYLAFYLAGKGCPPGSIGISHGIYWDDPFYQKDESVRREHVERVLASIENLDTLVSVDTNTINWLRATRASLAGKCVYLPNFVDLDEYRPSPRPRGGRTVILYPRRLHPPRGFWLVAEVLPGVLEAHPEVDFHFVGEANPAEREAAEKLVERFPGRVRWTTLPPERMREAYEGAEIVLIPTVASEGTSLACLEAQACGRAVIATNVGGLPDLVQHEHNGLLIEPHAGALRDAIERLLLDPELRRRLGGAAADSARRFGLDAWRSRWRALLSECLEPRFASARIRAERFPVTAFFPAPRRGASRPEAFRRFASRLARCGVDVYWGEGPDPAPKEDRGRLHRVPAGQKLFLTRPLVFLDRSRPADLAGIEVPEIVYDLPPEPRALLRPLLKERRREALKKVENTPIPPDSGPAGAELRASIVRTRRELAEARAENRALASAARAPAEPTPVSPEAAAARAAEAAERRIASIQNELRRAGGRDGRPADYDVFVLPIISWEFRFQRPQQLATQFGRHGHRVFYLATNSYFPPDGPAWDLRGKAPNVGELLIRSRRHLDIYGGKLEEADLDVLAEAFAAFARDQEVRQGVCIVQIPFWTPLALRLRQRFGWRIVYDCMDEWTNFPGFGRDVLAHESGLVRESDVTVVSAERLAEKWRPMASRLVLAQNGVDLTHYFARYGENDLLQDVRHPIIGYYGALAAWVDVPLLEQIARRFPKATVVLAGGQFDIDLSPVSNLPNVRLLGQRPYEEMPWLLWHFDVCIIPFVVNDITEATNPVKFYEYCFGGKPVVAPDLPELRPHSGLSYLARNHEEFLAGIERALQEPADDPRRQLRRQVAAGNDWEARYRTIDQAVREADASVNVRASVARLQEVFRFQHDRERRVREEKEALERRSREESAALGAALAEQTRQREEVERHNAVIGSELVRYQGLLQDREKELSSIQHSRLWKIATVYWGLLRFAKRLLRKVTGRPEPPPPAAASGSKAPAGETGDAEAAASPAPIAKANLYDVVCLPIIEWDFLFQRPQQLATRFAAAGHRVFYVSVTFRADGPPYELRRKGENIYEVSLRGPRLNPYQDVPEGEAGELYFRGLDQMRRDLALSATALVVELPFWWPVARQLRDRFGWPVIYDCMDDHAGFITNSKKMLEEEHELLAGADLVLASSGLLDEKVRRTNDRVLLLRNAGDYSHFARAARPRAKGARPVVGYFGAISDWFDTDLVAAVAKSRPDWDLILVGSTWGADLKQLSRLPNVRLVGQRPYAEIPDWLAQFDTAIIPFRRMPLTEATNPVKAYEMLASGKPVVSVPIPEMVPVAPLVRLASTAAEFEQAIADSLAEDDPEMVARRREFARANTWEKRFEQLEPAVRGIFPKASVIIVTYNNLELNRQCLASLFERTEWPNLEVIVVDNGSVDGTPEFLRGAEKTYPGLRVVLNEKNLGFAGGNNVGLKIATGDFLVLLNNDTVLSRGWLTALLRHLRADPELGMVGPVSNEIANEAKIPVGYTDLKDLPAWAERHVREHDGEAFPIRMLAMFCVAFRRELLEKVGLLDDRYQFGMFEDDDYSRRIHAEGLKTACARDSFVHHAGRASFKLLGDARYFEIFEKNRRYYQQKWGDMWQPHVDEKDRQRIEPLRERAREIVRESGVDPSRVVIFLPATGWEIPLAHRSHHLAAELARQGFLVFFDCTGSIPDHFANFVNLEPNLWKYNGPVGVLPAVEDPILWAVPYNSPLVEQWERRRVVYDWLDDLSAFPYRQEVLEKKHERMLREATVVLCGSEPLLEKARVSRPDAVYFPNAVEFERFANPAEGIVLDPEFLRLADSGRPIAGYCGTLNEHFDQDLLAEAARRRPDWEFVLIGRKGEEAPSFNDLEGLPNVHVFDAKPYPYLPAYLARFTAALIPMRLDRATEASSPKKLYEYLAAGVPVISSALPECRRFPEVHIVGSPEELCAALDLAAEESKDEGAREKLRVIARSNTWKVRVETLREILGPAPEAGPGGAAPETRTEVPASPPPEAAAVAGRFAQQKTPRNSRFFDALARHLAPLKDDPCLELYFDFNIRANERGREAAKRMRKQTKLRGKRYLDVGCGCGGFLVAFAEEGAEAAGIDVVPSLLELARENLRDNGLDCPVWLKNAGKPEDVQDLFGGFDVVTCNDVAEHVEDPGLLIKNASRMLAPGGTAYFEIPNGAHPGHVLEDGHYKLFGITLLDRADARRYYEELFPGRPYDTWHYLRFEDYERLFREAGLELRVLEESFEFASPDTIRRGMEALRAEESACLARVPGPVRGLVAEKLRDYTQAFDAASRNGSKEKRAFLLRYGASHWRLMASAAGA